MKARLIDFADEIQICGAKELYRTNFFIVRLVWIVIVCLGSLTTVWYVQRTIREYNNSPTGTNVDFTTSRWYHYPNIALCPNIWLDFIQMARLRVSVEALKYGLSFVYIPKEDRFLFNADEQGKGKVEFLTFIHNNTIVDYLDFYKLISKPPEQVVEITDLDLNATAQVAHMHFFEKQMCYVINLPEHDCSLQTSSVEPLINVYFSNDDNNTDLNLTDKIFHIVHVNVDLKFPSSSGNKLTIYPQTNYVLKISSLKKFTRLNTKMSRCRKDDGKSLYSQNFCHSNCLQHRFMKVYYKCLMFGLFEGTTDVERIPLCNSANFNLSLSEPDVWYNVVEECSSECIPPCTQNRMEISMTVESIGNKQPVSSIKVIFDVCAYGIMVYEQFERYTFENLIGDVGGLLGLWIGASIVTFVQLVMCLFELCVIKVAKQKLPV